MDFRAVPIANAQLIEKPLRFEISVLKHKGAPFNAYPVMQRNDGIVIRVPWTSETLINGPGLYSFIGSHINQDPVGIRVGRYIQRHDTLVYNIAAVYPIPPIHINPKMLDNDNCYYMGYVHTGVEHLINTQRIFDTQTFVGGRLLFQICQAAISPAGNGRFTLQHSDDKIEWFDVPNGGLADKALNIYQNKISTGKIYSEVINFAGLKRYIRWQYIPYSIYGFGFSGRVYYEMYRRQATRNEVKNCPISINAIPEDTEGKA